ncbi:MAG TPA: ankyrin repeat domain-containing protein, partial [Gammaproteobacteria bacterium]|nr:ankyrin repeat domain-containing protein [Gammaproteobacteria bacterium]
IHCVDPAAGTTALHKACQAGSLPIVRMLVEAGAFVDQQLPTTGHTPLLMAIWFKWDDIVEYFLDNGATLNLRTHFSFTLDDQLNFALKVTQKGRDKLLRIIDLVNKRRTKDKAAEDRQKLMAATVAGDLAGVEAALAAGANVDERFPLINVFNDGHTPLIVAARDGFTGIVKALIAAGADVNAVEPTFGAVPLHKAAYNGHADILEILAAQPGIELNALGPSNGYTPLHDAIWLGYPDCAEVLVCAGARLDIEGHDGKTPLLLAKESFGDDHPLVGLIVSKMVKQ